MLAALLDLLCYKFRNLTHAILFYEAVICAFPLMVPSDFYEDLPFFYLAVNYMLMFVIFYTDQWP